MKTHNGRIHIGTSGWHYGHWRGVFYQQHLKTENWLAAYTHSFNCVELNNSFYQFPKPAYIKNWLAATPEGFRFAVKASRLITHMKNLHECDELVQRFILLSEQFGQRLGPILFQLPPRWRVDPDRLQAFLESLPSQHRYTFEFRDPSWHRQTIYTMLEQHGAAFCCFDIFGLQSPIVETADWVYVRLHGPLAQPYVGRYPETTLRHWAEQIQFWSQQDREVFLFFDNDDAGHAPMDALRLLGLLDLIPSSRAL